MLLFYGTIQAMNLQTVKYIYIYLTYIYSIDYIFSVYNYLFHNGNDMIIFNDMIIYKRHYANIDLLLRQYCDNINLLLGF